MANISFVLVVFFLSVNCRGVSFPKDPTNFFSFVNKSSKNFTVVVEMKEFYDPTKISTQTFVMVPNKKNRRIVDMINYNWAIDKGSMLIIDDTVMYVRRYEYSDWPDKLYALNIVNTERVDVTDDTEDLNAANVGSLWVKIDSIGYARSTNKMYVRVYDSRDVGMND
jgi:hypothetical protein